MHFSKKIFMVAGLCWLFVWSAFSGTFQQECQNLKNTLKNLELHNGSYAFTTSWNFKESSRYLSLIESFMLAKGHNFAYLYGASKRDQEDRFLCKYSRFPVFSDEGNQLAVCDPLGAGYQKAEDWLIKNHGTDYYSKVSLKDEKEPLRYQLDFVSGLINPNYQKVTGKVPPEDEVVYGLRNIHSVYLAMRTMYGFTSTDKNHIRLYHEMLTNFFINGIVNPLSALKKLNLPADQFYNSVDYLDEKRELDWRYNITVP